MAADSIVYASAAAAIIGAAVYAAIYMKWLPASWSTPSRIADLKDASMLAMAVGGAGLAYIEVQNHEAKKKDSSASGAGSLLHIGASAAAPRGNGDFAEAVRRYVQARQQ